MNKAILILVGNNGSGKTHWVEELGLQDFSLSKNYIRSIFFGLTYDYDFNFWVRDLSKERIVHEEYLKILEMRLRTGGFIIIDSAITRAKSFNCITSLAKSYGYSIFVKVFNPGLDICLSRNNDRDNSYEHSLNETIIKKQSQLDIFLGYLNKLSDCKVIENIDEISKIIFPDVLVDSELIHFIGDIHGDIVSLENFLDKNFNKTDTFIFLGDYLDRGSHNREVLEKMIELSQESNVILLEGNHELHLWCWSYDRKIVSGEFLNNTKPDLEIDPNLKIKVRILLNKLKLFVRIPEHSILACHGGISKSLYSDRELLLDQSSFIRGHRFPNDTSELSDMRFSERSNGWVHIHGHRNNMKGYPINPFPYVYNIDNCNDRIRTITYNTKKQTYDTGEY